MNKSHIGAGIIIIIFNIYILWPYHKFPDITLRLSVVEEYSPLKNGSQDTEIISILNTFKSLSRPPMSQSKD